ncbi:glycosyltransferase [Microlunatus parietis]|uniref:Sterol 3beta-glucosyltransferase n=1 Tax=Microlunatus parietis TaxID=682979 RepID=A0A7Y9IB25_9ACTN|nr:glycosyltransferase [Microlunatus parietis]NYE73405.1 sterol 3beta-glucosyltransferase [Microlunatus parietis]
MKVMIFTHGTRGDVQPFAALARALQAAGHDAVLVAPEGSASLVAPYEFSFVPVYDGLNEIMDDPEVRAAMETNFRGLRGKRMALRLIRRTSPMLRRMLDELAAVPAAGADVVVHPVNLPMQHLAEKLGRPAVGVGLQPGWVPTGSFANPLLPFPVPCALNRASYRLPNPALMGLAGVARQWRSETLGLPRRPNQGDPLRTPAGARVTMLQAFSEHVLPGPLEFPSWTHTTGYWFLPASSGWTPPERLRAFLDTDEPTVSIGFGSMSGTDPGRVGRTVVEAVRLAGVRAVVITGWGGIDTTPAGDRIMIIDQAPHDWLFARTAANVHHGGGGTTAAALAAGRPQVICPFIADQPYWGERMMISGVAPAPLPQRRLTVESLAGALRQAVGDAGLAARAAELGRIIRAENGVGRAVELIHEVVRQASGSGPGPQLCS